MANIGLDATNISIYGKGIHRYQYGLIKALSKFDEKNRYYVFLNKKNILPDLPKSENFNYIKARIPMRIMWEQFQLPLVIKKYKLDIYHSTSDTLPCIGKVKFILFLFEIPDYRRELLRRSGCNSLYAEISGRYSEFLCRPSFKKAGIIMAGSYNTKKDLIEKYNIDEKKIRVLYPAYDEHFCAANGEMDLLNTRKKYNAETGYIFHISSQDPRDNTISVIHAYKKAQSKSGIHQKLIIFGGVDYRKIGLDKLIIELNLKNSVIFTGRLPENELIALYQAADLFIDPSLYEGFGFQVVEAMACGIPVITSNLTSLPEIVSTAGILLSPTDIDGLADALSQVLTDSGLRQLMRQKSLERAKFFSWDRLAQETLGIYENIA